MPQAADRRQPGATSTPPSLPASGWRRDLSPDNGGAGAARTEAGGAPAIERVPAGTFARVPVPVPSLRRERPAAVVVLAPVLGLAVWVALALAVL